MAFYRLRKALRALGLEGEITPQTPISIINSVAPESISQKWNQLAQHSGLDLPALEVPFRGADRWPILFRCLGYAAIAAPFCVWALVFNKCPWLFYNSSVVFWLGFIFGCPAVLITIAHVLWIVFRAVPLRLRTIGGLAREAAGCSFAKLVAEKKGCRPSDRWFALAAILRDNSGHKTAITRHTTFFARVAKSRARY